MQRLHNQTAYPTADAFGPVGKPARFILGRKLALKVSRLIIK